MAVLEYLAAVPGKVVSAEELIQAVWHGRPMGDSPVYRCVSQLRRAFGDDSRQPRYIATVPTKGYRLVAPVERSVTIAPETAGPVAPAARQPGWRARGVHLGVLAVLLGATVWFAARTGNEAVPQMGSDLPALAVLPFEAHPATEDNIYLADGLSDEVLNRLSRYRDLRVVARTSSFAFRGDVHEPRRVADVLGVDYVVQGRVQRHGDQLRVRAELVGRDGYEAWSGTFEHGAGGPLVLQAQLADAIAAHLGFTPPEAVPERSFEVMQHYLYGREQLVRRPPGFAAAAQAHLDRAIALDPGFADAWAERAIARLFLGLSEREGKAQWEAAAEDIDRALALDPASATAHAARGFRLSLLGHQYRPQAEASLRQALALDPHLVNAWNWLAGVTRQQGREQEADEALLQAASIDPLAPTIGANLAGTEARRGDFESAETRLLRLRLAPQPGYLVHSSLVSFYIDTGRLGDALLAARQATLQTLPDSAFGMGEVVLVHTRLGAWEHADAWAARMLELMQGHPTFELHIATDALYRPQPGLHTAWQQVESARVENGIAPDQMAVHLRLKYGVLASLAGEHQVARAVLEPVLDEKVALQGMESEEEPNARQALAWAWLHSGEASRAQALLAGLDGWFRSEDATGRLALGPDRYMWARNLAVQGREDEALEVLESAERAGWRGVYELQADPRWDALRDSPGFAEISARIEQDLARQRAEIEARHPEAEFVAQVDALMRATLALNVRD